jgi:hypothetical protein
LTFLSNTTPPPCWIYEQHCSIYSPTARRSPRSSSSSITDSTTPNHRRGDGGPGTSPHRRRELVRHELPSIGPQVTFLPELDLATVRTRKFLFRGHSQRTQ